MGLDMYLMADTIVEGAEEHESESSYLERRLAQWRKHPNLHGYIAQKYAGGVDECQRIPLTIEQVEDVLAASEADRLPTTMGFFFGTTTPSDKADTKEKLEEVLAWMRGNPSRRVYYRASW